MDYKLKGKSMNILRTACAALLCLAGTAQAFTLQGTMWERASRASTCNPPVLLLYSLALQESRTSAGKGMVRPHPYALRNAPSGSLYPATYDEANAHLSRFISEDRLTDIGIMQINLRWNGHRVTDPSHLLQPETNIRVGAQILCEAIAANKGDIELAIGGYHTMNPRREVDARQYARNVLLIWRALQKIERKGA